MAKTRRDYYWLLVYFIWIGNASTARHSAIKACTNHKICHTFAIRKDFYCQHKWVRKNCRLMCELCRPACLDHRVCRFYKVSKSHYCKHKWLKNNCKSMCGYCKTRCKGPDHRSCSNYVRASKFYCPHRWLRKNCNQMCGRCSGHSFGPKWPAGQYGILSRDRCPPKWFEFNHCMDNDNAGLSTSTFKLSPSWLRCDATSTTFRYCFKGPAVPTRPGGFWTNNRHNGAAYVIRNVIGGCEEFGSDGGLVDIDNEDQNNKNRFGNKNFNGEAWPNYHPFDFILFPYARTRLSFCKIGSKGRSRTSSTYIEVGWFNGQKFGFFVRPPQACPAVMSPYGILHGRKEVFFTNDEQYLGSSRVLRGKPPVEINKKKARTKWSVCQYNPKKGI